MELDINNDTVLSKMTGKIPCVQIGETIETIQKACN